MTDSKDISEDKAPKKARLVKVTANVPVRDVDTTTQRCWGVEFDVVEVKDGFSLIAKLPKAEADAMKEAGRVA